MLKGEALVGTISHYTWFVCSHTSPDAVGEGVSSKTCHYPRSNDNKPSPNSEEEDTVDIPAQHPWYAYNQTSLNVALRGEVLVETPIHNLWSHCILTSSDIEEEAALSVPGQHCQPIHNKKDLNVALRGEDVWGVPNHHSWHSNRTSLDVEEITNILTQRNQRCQNNQKDPNIEEEEHVVS